MKTKHTPGPWRVDGRRGSIWTAPYSRGALGCGRCIADVTHSDNTERQRADARLIAAAPELLDALEELMQYVGGWDCPASHPCGKARDVLAKVAGE